MRKEDLLDLLLEQEMSRCAHTYGEVWRMLTQLECPHCGIQLSTRSIVAPHSIEYTESECDRCGWHVRTDNYIIKEGDGELHLCDSCHCIVDMSYKPERFGANSRIG